MPTKQRSKPSALRRNSAPARSSPNVQEIRQGLGLNRKLFSRLTGYSERALADWEAGKQLGEASRQRMVEMQRLQQALCRVMRDEFVGQWLQTPNEAFDGLKPVEVVERGEIDRLWRMVYFLESGQPAG